MSTSDPFPDNRTADRPLRSARPRGTWWRTRRPRTGWPRTALVAGAALLIAAGVAGCSNSLPSSVSKAPVLSVVTGLYPLARAVTSIGGSKVAVEDVVPDGSNPFTYTPTASQADALRSAGLVVQVGGGFQPGVEAAAAGAHSILSLHSALGTADGYVWLDPATMEKAVTSIASAMAAADPLAGPLFRQNATSFNDEIASTGMDFSSTFSACPGTVLVTPDNAFSAMAAEYGLVDHVVAAGETEPRIEALARSLRDMTDPSGMISEPWVDDAGVTAAAAAAGVEVHHIDTLAGVPAGGWPSGGSYITLMDQNLNTFTDALGCNSSDNDDGG